jgi:hypothetical protein
LLWAYGRILGVGNHVDWLFEHDLIGKIGSADRILVFSTRRGVAPGGYWVAVILAPPLYLALHSLIDSFFFGVLGAQIASHPYFLSIDTGNEAGVIVLPNIGLCAAAVAFYSDYESSKLFS